MQQPKNSHGLGKLLGIPIIPHLIAGMCVLCLLLVTSWLWIEVAQRFPRLPQGSYYGRIQGLFQESAANGVPFFVDSTDSNEFMVVLLHPQWQPQRITMVPRGATVEESEWLHPVVVAGETRRLKFMGTKSGDEYRGNVVDQDTRARGQWSLRLVPVSRAETGLDAKEIETWLRLKAELDTVEDDIRKAERRVPEQKKEIEKISAFITEGDSLRARAEKKFQDVSRQLEKASEELHQQETAAQDLEERLVLAQAVTDMGKLVSLSRQTLERENRWIDSALGGQIPPLAEDFSQALERAKKIMGVKRAIAEEQEYINHLESLMQNGRSGTPGAPGTAAPQSFDSIWGGRR